MLECPNAGCSGRIDEGCCTFCGQTFPLDRLLLRFPAPESVRREQDEREDFAVREA